MLPRFLKRKQKTKNTDFANKKGQGFRVFKKSRHDQAAITLRKKTIITGIVATVAAFLALMIAGQFASADFMFVLGGIVVLCGILAYDILGRRIWETRLTATVEKLSQNHDRLVREVARNRSDIGILKEGLGEIAHRQTSDVPHENAIQSKQEKNLVKDLVSKLGQLGDAPRPEIGTKFDSPILELEMAPPPSSPIIGNDLDRTMNPDIHKFSDTVVAELVQHAVRNDKVNIFMQPVVNLPQRKTRMYEIYGRVRANAGIYLPAARYMDFAQREELVAAIDNLILLRCLNMLRERSERDLTTPYILNVSENTLRDRSFMGDLVTFLSTYHKMASRLIFEIPQAELMTLDIKTKTILAALSKLGCRFSMDRVRQRRFDLNFLKQNHIRFLKLEASWLLKEGATREGHNRIIRLKKQMDSYGIDLIVEKIEGEDMLRELLDFNIDYGQGYLFGKPDHSAAYRDQVKQAA